MIGYPERDPHVRVHQGRRGEHGHHHRRPGDAGEAATVRHRDGDGQRGDDHVDEGLGHVHGVRVQAEKEFQDGDERQFEGVKGDVADDPAVQHEVAVQHVPGLQRVIGPVRGHQLLKRDPQEQREHQGGGGRPPQPGQTADQPRTPRSAPFGCAGAGAGLVGLTRNHAAETRPSPLGHDVGIGRLRSVHIQTVSVPPVTTTATSSTLAAHPQHRRRRPSSRSATAPRQP